MNNDAADIALLEWEKKQHPAITGDPLWRLNCYREALFLVELAHSDLASLAETASADAEKQLLKAVGSIAANIGEGYGRPTTADRVRFFSYALGSAREALAWYQTLRPSIEHSVTDDRLERLARVRRMLLGLLARLRTQTGRKFDSW